MYKKGKTGLANQDKARLSEKDIFMAVTLVSVIIPVYNVRDYITDCLVSVSEQTYTNNVECLIVDDCGKDDSILLAQAFVDGYEGDIDFRILRHERNRGLSAARNTGIVNARGTYVLFVDSDDTIMPDCLSRLMNVAHRYPAAEIVAAGAETNWKGLEKQFTMEKPFPDYADNPQWIARTILMRGGKDGIPVTAWNRLVKKDFLLEHKLLFREGILHEDELWNFMLAQKVSHIAFCKHNTYFYRLRPQSIMTGFRDKDVHAMACLPVWKEMLEHFTPDLEKEQTHSLWQCINDVSPNCRNRIVRKEVFGILTQLVRKGIWPTSYLIGIYLLPFVFYVKFIRKLVAKMSKINVARYSCCIS